MHVPPTEANDAAEPMEGIIIIACFLLLGDLYLFCLYSQSLL